MKQILLILLLMLIVSVTQATTYYFSQSGSDSNNGLSTLSPKKTIAHLNTLTLSAGDSILFKKGDTWTGESLAINDNGSVGNPIVYGAYGTGANPIITGFASVTAWTNLGSNIWESTNAVSTLTSCNLVTINGENTAMGRYPNSDAANGGYLTYQSHAGTTSITSSSLTGTPNWTGATAVIKSNFYTIDRGVISSQSGGTLNFSPSLTFEPLDRFGFFIQNDVRTLDQQNEWYYNPTTKKIRIYSTSQPTNVKVASIDNLITFYTFWNGSGNTATGNYTTIQDISLTGANLNGFYIGSTTVFLNNVNLNRLSISFLGRKAIHLRGNYLNIENCQINHSHSTAVDVMFSDYVEFTNNTVENSGLLDGMGDGCFSAIRSGDYTPQGKHYLFEYNIVRNSSHNGIGFGGDTTTIRYNFIDTFCTQLEDGAAIYGGQNAIITKNVIINGIGNRNGTDATSNFPSIAAGVYCDNNSSNCEVSYNSIADCAGYGIFNNDNIGGMNVHHNTVFNASDSQYRINNKSGEQSYNFTVNNNIFVAKAAEQECFMIAGTLTNIPLIGTINNNIYARPVDDDNTISRLSPTETLLTLAQWQSYSGHDANSTKSPKAITTTDDIAFAYNATDSPATVILPFPGIDMAGNRYGTTPVLPAYSSIVILKDLTNPSGSLHPLGIPGTGQVFGIPAPGQVFGKP